MRQFTNTTRLLCAFTPLLTLAAAPATVTDGVPFPYPEKLSYRVEWRLVTAGSANVQFTRAPEKNWDLDLTLESAGLVSRLLRVLDTYKVQSNEKFCGVNLNFDAQEGKRHTTTQIDFDNQRHKVQYTEKDLVKHTVDKRDMTSPPCTYEITGALLALREMRLEPGKSVTLPISNGKKIAYAKVEAQAKENINVDGKQYATVRYEPFIFDDVLYRRKGRLLIWMTDDADHVPVQMRFQMGFPIGSITLELEKHEKL